MGAEAIIIRPTAAEPRFCTPRTGRATYGGEVAKLARLLGFTPMAHQRLFWDIALEHEEGVLAYREIGWTIPRQCGKSTALILLMLWRCLRWPGQVVRYAAQTGMDARAKLADDWWPLLEHSPLAEVLSFRRQSGHEALIFENGSRLGLIASTEKSGHGSTLDTAVLDESWAHADHRLEQSCRPAMATRSNAQMIVVSTAGTEQRSPFLWEKVCAGRQAVEAGVTDGMAYLEWSAEPDADPADPQTWRQAIPALGVTISEATIRADLQGMPRHDFQRSFLNMWTLAMGDAVIDLATWQALAEPDAPRPANHHPRRRSGTAQQERGSSRRRRPRGAAPRRHPRARARNRLGRPPPGATAGRARRGDRVGREGVRGHQPGNSASLDVTEIDGGEFAAACAFLVDLVERDRASPP